MLRRKLTGSKHFLVGGVGAPAGCPSPSLVLMPWGLEVLAANSSQLSLLQRLPTPSAAALLGDGWKFVSAAFGGGWGGSLAND